MLKKRICYVMQSSAIAVGVVGIVFILAHKLDSPRGYILVACGSLVAFVTTCIFYPAAVKDIVRIPWSIITRK